MPDDALSDSDRTESDRPVGDSEETEDELYPHIPPQARVVSSTPVPAPWLVVGVGGQRGVAKAVKKGSRRPAVAKRGAKEGSEKAETRTKKKPVGKVNAGKKKGPKRRKVAVDVGAGEGGDDGAEGEEVCFFCFFLSWIHLQWLGFGF